MTEATESLELVQDEIDTPLGKLTLVVDGQGRLRLLGWHEGHERMGRGLQAYATGKGARSPATEAAWSASAGCCSTRARSPP
jgi:hypothetical protein